MTAYTRWPNAWLGTTKGPFFAEGLARPSRSLLSRAIAAGDGMSSTSFAQQSCERKKRLRERARVRGSCDYQLESFIIGCFLFPRRNYPELEQGTSREKSRNGSPRPVKLQGSNFRHGFFTFRVCLFRKDPKGGLVTPRRSRPGGTKKNVPGHGCSTNDHNGRAGKSLVG